MITYKYKAYNSKHNKKIHQLIDISGIVWNHCIALQKRYYKMYEKYISKTRMQKHIAKIRWSEEAWQLLNSQTVQEVVERVDEGYQRFFKNDAERPPTFKKVKKYTSFTFKQSGYKISDNRLTINNINKTFKFHKSRDYENIKRITIKRDKLGDIWFCLVLDKEPKKHKREGNSSIGIDFGLKTYLTLNNGTTIDSPRVYKEFESKLRKAHKNLSTKKKGSNNRKKALSKLRRVYKDLDNKRSDKEWKLAHKLCKNYAFIAIEDLNIEAMKRMWGKKVSDLSFSTFVKKLEHIAKKYDTVIYKVDRFYPSTKTCSNCGNKKNLSLSDRKYKCEKCGLVEDRDVNAAKNILSQGIDSYCTKHKTSLEAV